MKTKKEKKGAGKPAFFSKPMKRVNIMLDEDTVKFYTEQGKGNLSEGIRQYWRRLTLHKEWCEVGDGTPCNCGAV
jgi:uncharacterized protein (DUF4415 family)